MAKSPLRNAEVLRVDQISPNMRRIVLGGAEMRDFPTGAEGGYIKLIFPDAPGYGPENPAMRTYSVRAHDVDAGTITVDFALHGEVGGLATRWAETARTGAVIPITGPGRVKMLEGAPDWVLLAADMTGLPALMCNLDRLDPKARGYVVVEVTDEADKPLMQLPPGIALHWVVNPAPDRSKGGLLEQIRALPWLDGVPFVWTACEFDTMRALRSYYRTDRNVDRDACYLSSYWRAGRTEDQHKIDKRKDSTAAAPA